MSTVVYVATSLIWSLGGFLLGYVLGRAARTLQHIDRKVRMDMVDGKENEAKPAPRRVTDRPRAEQLFGGLLVALAVFSVIGVGIQTVRLNDTTRCQAEWNDSYTAALKQRTKAAARERGAQREMFTLWLSGPTRQEAIAALKKYVDSLKKADEEREDAKIPARKCD